MSDSIRRMNHPHTIFDKDTSVNEVPNFSLILTFYKHPRSLEQALSTAKKHAFNKNHEYICVADDASQEIHPHYPPIKLMEEIQSSGYLLNPDNPEKIRGNKFSLKYCMDKYTNIEYVDLFDYLRGDKKVDGFDYRMGHPMVNARHGRGNFYLGYNLGACLAKNDYIMQMVNDDMLFTPNWDLELWRAFSKMDHKNHTCVPVAHIGFFDNKHPTVKDLLLAGAEPAYNIKENNFDSNATYIFEEDFLKHGESVKIKNSYLIELQYHRHYGYMGFILMHKDLFFKVKGYSMNGWPKASQDIVFDGVLGNMGINKVVVLDVINLHERVHYIENETKKILVGE